MIKSRAPGLGHVLGTARRICASCRMQPHNVVPVVDRVCLAQMVVGLWWQVLGSNQRRLSRRFYRPAIHATDDAS